MKTKFKANVYGFIYDSQYGEVTKVFNKPLNELEKKVITEVIGEYDCLFTDINSVNELFTFEDENSLNCDSEGLNRVLEFEVIN
jgi:hypothetical protein